MLVTWPSALRDLAFNIFGVGLRLSYIFCLICSSIILSYYVLCIYRVRPHFIPGIPIVQLDGEDSTSGGIFSQNARNLLIKGIERHPGQSFQVMTTSGPRIVLPNSFADEIKERTELEFFNNFSLPYHGFESQRDSFEGKDGGMLARIVRTKLTQRLGLLTGCMADEASEALQEVFGDGTNWHVSVIKRDLYEVAARMTSRVFLGRDLARDSGWLKIAKEHTFQMHKATLQLKGLSKPLRWPLQWFLSSCRALRQQVIDARKIIGPETRKRFEQMKATSDGEKGPKTMDALSWILEVDEKRKLDPVHLQLALSVVSITTSGEVMAQAIMDMCEHPEVVSALREEIIKVVKENGWQKSTFYHLMLMDSFLKESQRVHALNWCMKSPFLPSSTKYRA